MKSRWMRWSTAPFWKVSVARSIWIECGKRLTRWKLMVPKTHFVSPISRNCWNYSSWNAKLPDVSNIFKRTLENCQTHSAQIYKRSAAELKSSELRALERARAEEPRNHPNSDDVQRDHGWLCAKWGDEQSCPDKAEELLEQTKVYSQTKCLCRCCKCSDLQDIIIEYHYIISLYYYHYISL